MDQLPSINRVFSLMAQWCFQWWNILWTLWLKDPLHHENLKPITINLQTRIVFTVLIAIFNFSTCTNVTSYMVIILDKSPIIPTIISQETSLIMFLLLMQMMILMLIFLLSTMTWPICPGGSPKINVSKLCLQFALLNHMITINPHEETTTCKCYSLWNNSEQMSHK